LTSNWPATFHAGKSLPRIKVTALEFEGRCTRFLLAIAGTTLIHECVAAKLIMPHQTLKSLETAENNDSY
jgi:hypothetical protein